MIIRRDALRAVLAATCDDATRYALHAVEVRPDGTLAATNGHVALVATDKAPFTDADFPVVQGAEFVGNLETAVLVERTVLEGLIATMPKRSPIPILHAIQLGKNGSEGGAVAVATDLEAPRVARIKANEAVGRFPPLAKVLPAADRPCLKVCLGLPVLKALIKAAEAVGRNGKAQGTITLLVPTQAKHQGMRQAEGVDHPFHADGYGTNRVKCVTCGKGEAAHKEPDGAIVGVIGVRIEGEDVRLDGACMPCRTPCRT